MEQEKLARIRERKARYQRNWRKKRKLQGLADMDGALDLEEVAAEGRGTSEEDYGAYHAPRESDSDIAEVDYDLLECTGNFARFGRGGRNLTRGTNCLPCRSCC